MPSCLIFFDVRQSASHSQSAMATSDDDVADPNSSSDPAVSEKFRQRMQPCREPVNQRASCPCCGRNFRQASECLTQFRETVSRVDELADMTETERRVLMSDDFLLRLLARCGGDWKKSEERLVVARAVHRKYNLDSRITCRLCTSRPGYHSFRQVGFDRLGRPVLYNCLNQEAETGTQPEQVREYFLHLIFAVGEAEKTIPEGQHSLVLVFDTRGLGLSHVRMDTVSQFGEMLSYFPARMSYALMLNMSGVARFLLKPVIHLTGHQDDVLILSQKCVDRQLAECFEPPLVHWMLCEMERNLEPKMRFVSGPGEQQPGQPPAHDPRGEASYVQNYVLKNHPSGHMPHPSIAAANPAAHGGNQVEKS